MKISIGTNVFGQDIKQTLGLQTQFKLKSLYPDVVSLYSFQKEHQHFVPDTHIVMQLQRDARDFVEGGTKTSPCVKDILDGLAETDCDYFVFCNSDVLFTQNFINYLLEDRFTGYACSRLDIRPINALNEPIFPYRYEVAGQDAFVFKKDWYIKHRSLFKEYLMGAIWYDTAYTCILKQFGQNDPIVNGCPVQLCHIHHGWGSGKPCPENSYNTKLYDSEIREIKEPWSWFYHNILVNRPNGFGVLNLYPNEKEIEKQHFGRFMLKL